jgi:hypothetical protein
LFNCDACTLFLHFNARIKTYINLYVTKKFINWDWQLTYHIYIYIYIFKITAILINPWDTYLTSHLILRFCSSNLPWFNLMIWINSSLYIYLIFKILYYQIITIWSVYDTRQLICFLQIYMPEFISQFQPCVTKKNHYWLHFFRFCPRNYYPFDPYDTKKYVVDDDYTPMWQVLVYLFNYWILWGKKGDG